MVRILCLWWRYAKGCRVSYSHDTTLPKDTALTTDASANQSEFWNQSAATKVFSHPLDHARFAQTVARDAAILDYGCGRGRLCGELAARGFTQVVGADFSTEMIAAARRDHPSVSFTHVDGATLPFGDASFDAVMLFAVLTCIPPRTAQRTLIADTHRVLKRGGLLVVSDYPLQSDARNVARYDAYAKETHDGEACDYGTFRLPDGGTVRHHAMSWFDELFAQFTVEERVEFDATTMNGNPARIAQWWLRA